VYQNRIISQSFINKMNSIFHPYGLLVGIGIVVAFQLSEIQAKKHRFPHRELGRLGVWLLVGGIIGARLYHVMSEFILYQHQLWYIFAVWEGGLSIIGGMAGALCALFLYSRYYKKDISFIKTVADIAVLGLPFGQAIGRLGNFFNQELYGFPTTLPWGIFIDPQHRLAGFELYQKFHPLFLYEMIGVLIIGSGLWWGERQKIWRVGSGQLALMYVIAYALLRFCLDFLRIDKHLILFLHLGTNQIVLLGVLLVSIVLWRYSDDQK
jgi:prolipoprotein diacylglyceryl transferase